MNRDNTRYREMDEMERRRRAIREKRRRLAKKRRQERMIMRGCCVFPLVIALICGLLWQFGVPTQAATIYVETQNIEMYQDSSGPSFETVITVKGNVNKVLDKETKYTVADLIADLESGAGIEFTCEALDTYVDGEGYLDGVYEIEMSLTSEYQQKLLEEWIGKIDIQFLEGGSLNVMNSVGYWDGDVFVDWDGNIVKEQWVKVKGQPYFIDGEGHKTTSSQYQEGITIYTFDENGVITNTETLVDPDKPMIALTFDDGPGPYTMKLLEALEEYNVRATFFMQGANFQDGEQEILQKMVEIGCELGNHSTTHPDLATLSASAVQEEMDKTDALILEYCGELPTVMRPPYGSTDEEAEAVIEYPIIHWNVDTEDWRTDNAADVLEVILAEASDGDIILMHDVKSWSVDAAIEAIPILLEQGYQLVTVTEMAEARGIDMEAGEVYYMFP